MDINQKLLDSGISQSTIDKFVKTKIKKMKGLINEKTALLIMFEEKGLSIKEEQSEEQSDESSGEYKSNDYSVKEIKEWAKLKKVDEITFINLSNIEVFSVKIGKGNKKDGSKWKSKTLGITNNEDAYENSKFIVKTNLTDFTDLTKRIVTGNSFNISNIIVEVMEFTNDDDENIHFARLRVTKDSVITNFRK